MLSQRIQQHFIDSADLNYQCAQLLAAPVEAAVNALPKVSGAWGSGRVLEGTLFSLVLTDNGRVAIGAVAPDALYAALAAPAAG